MAQHMQNMMDNEDQVWMLQSSGGKFCAFQPMCSKPEMQTWGLESLICFGQELETEFRSGLGQL